MAANILDRNFDGLNTHNYFNLCSLRETRLKIMHNYFTCEKHLQVLGNSTSSGIELKMATANTR